MTILETAQDSPIPIYFSAPERDILLHRLEVPDAVADALAEEFPDRESVTAGCLGLVRELSECRVLVDTKLKEEILVDALAGSTFLTHDGVDNGDVSPKEHATLLRAAHRLSAKLGAAFGREVRVPSS